MPSSARAVKTIPTVSTWPRIVPDSDGQADSEAGSVQVEPAGCVQVVGLLSCAGDECAGTGNRITWRPSP